MNLYINMRVSSVFTNSYFRSIIVLFNIYVFSLVLKKIQQNIISKLIYNIIMKL